VALPLANRVGRVAGRRHLLVGDAAGFIDPLTGEGIHRALVSSALAAEAISSWLNGDRNALTAYDRRLRARFRNKDVVSWLLQLFLATPALLDYAVARLERRDRLRDTLTLVMTDQLRPSRALDPRFLARLLAP
jgi:flavin-dependent dehydrogenase